MMKEQIVDCGEETQPTDLGVAATRPRSGNNVSHRGD